MPFERLARESLLPFNEIEDPNHVVFENPMWLIFHHLYHKHGIKDIGKESALKYGHLVVKPLAEQLKKTDTLLDALTEACQLLTSVSSNANFWVKTTTKGIWFCRLGSKGLTTGRIPIEQYSLNLQVMLIREVLNDTKWLPTKIMCQAKKGDFDKNDAFPHIAVLFDRPQSAIFVDNATLKRNTAKIITDSALTGIVESELTFDEFLNSLAANIYPLCNQTLPSVAILSQATGVPSRTLQRYFQEHGINARDFITKLTIDKAKHLFESGNTLKQASYELGYATPSHFSRAIKANTGQTPNDFRLSVLGQSEETK
ncbi:hypothetical protein VSU01S_13160 [Vibrio superstes NBRC 103154]|uniref:HTH araC/xylS-type domain-containing protein n=1 Tax=Vibrio superstes NBRC 103154 TaxID=1219062 RepID=A0A511QP10_9VIBR|nr:hypothetical protein VSU01S_13160 [Vibrio superstes NBRC 103154]